jgi:hypothetical protein
VGIFGKKIHNIRIFFPLSHFFFRVSSFEKQDIEEEKKPSPQFGNTVGLKRFPLQLIDIRDTTYTRKTDNPKSYLCLCVQIDGMPFTPPPPFSDSDRRKAVQNYNILFVLICNILLFEL